MLNKKVAIERYYKLCGERNLRITPQRTALFEAMLEAPDHPTAEVLYQRLRRKMPNISYDTVNRTLLSFAENGLIKQMQSRGSAKRFDPDTTAHHHFQCVKCNRIIDFEYEKYNQMEVPANLPKGLKVLEKKVVLEGICQQCQE